MSERLTPWLRVLGGLVLIAGLALAYWSPLGQTCRNISPPTGQFWMSFKDCSPDHARQTMILVVALLVGLPLLLAPWSRAKA
jgi:hypothetical protein